MALLKQNKITQHSSTPTRGKAGTLRRQWRTHAAYWTHSRLWLSSSKFDACDMLSYRLSMCTHR